MSAIMPNNNHCMAGASSFSLRRVTAWLRKQAGPSYTLAAVGVQVEHLGLAIGQKTWTASSLTQEYLHYANARNQGQKAST